MTTDPKSIDEHIECLARLTGAPDSFVTQVKELFTRKGITLDTDATPYLIPLEEAFQREEAIRADAKYTRQSVQRLQDNFNKLRHTYTKQLEQLRSIQASLRGQTTAKQKSSGKLRAVRIRGERHVYTTRTVFDELPMVPGPDDLQ